jgi:GntR family transcriptional regulator/MocR family aminotransferase
MISAAVYSAKLAQCGVKHLALYQTIRDAIADGKLLPGERLPSTRVLAHLYGLSRGSISLAYEMLAAEGFVQAAIGQGTFVAGWTGWAESIATNDEGLNAGSSASSAEPVLTKWARRLLELPSASKDEAVAETQEGEGVALLSFIPEGVGALWFPWSEWKAQVAQQWKRFGKYGRNEAQRAEGSLQLREALAHRLRRERGIACSAEEIIITAGSMQAITLLTQLFLEAGKIAVVENPSYAGIPQAILATGARYVTQEVDSCGIVPEEWDAQLLFVTPTRQFPTGAVLSYERRRSLLSWASRRNAWIVEDDYDSDFRWGGRPIEPLKSLDREGRVIYVGTFSRSMCAGVRIGYAVVPKELIQPMLAAKKLYDPYSSGLVEQQALAVWMSEGGFDRHMRRMRRIYGKLEGKLRQGFEQQLNTLFEMVPSDAGLHVYAKWLRSNEEYLLLTQECGRRGLTWKDGAVYAAHADRKAQAEPIACTALFGFAHLDGHQIDEGVARIRLAAESLGLIGSDEGLGGTIHA